jgi:hypothetical protein
MLLEIPLVPDSVLSESRQVQPKFKSGSLLMERYRPTKDLKSKTKRGIK